MTVNNVVLLSDILPSTHQRQHRKHEPRQDIIDLEFSDYGRDPRFLPGWWILPGILIGTAFTAWAAASV